MELTRAQINTILHQPIDESAIDAILAHDQAQREKIDILEREKVLARGCSVETAYLVAGTFVQGIRESREERS